MMANPVTTIAMFNVIGRFSLVSGSGKRLRTPKNAIGAMRVFDHVNHDALMARVGRAVTAEHLVNSQHDHEVRLLGPVGPEPSWQAKTPQGVRA